MKKTETRKNDVTETDFQKVANRVSMITIIGNMVLSVIKLLAGIIAHSNAMISDAIHSASDVFSTFVVIIGIKLASKKPDKEHPYGHERLECVAAIILAMVQFSRRVIAHKISRKIDTRLVLDTFESALKNRNYLQNVIFHSDRGSQYTSDEFRKRLDKAAFIQSFSKKGHPYDNAVAEAFFKFLKLEEINRNSYHSIEEVELSVFEYIHFYNFNRPHSANNLLSPAQFESLF